MLLDLSGKVGLIVGIANEQSIAWGCAKRMFAANAQLAITYGSEKTSTYTKPLAEQVNCPIFLPGDVTKPEDLQQVFEVIKAKWGKLDFLLHSIAFSPKQDLHGQVVNCSKEGFATTMDLSCHSLIKLCKLFQPLMLHGGSVLTMSYYGANKVIKNYNVMGIAKAALEAAARYLAYELAANDIRVNVLSPGPIMTRAAAGIADFKDLLAEAVNKAPLHKGVDIDSVGNLAAFLVSDLAKDLTGQIFYVDAGYSIMG